MKTILLLILAILCGGSGQAQYIFKIAGNQVNVTGNAQIVLKNTNWVNDGTFTATSGTVVLTGDATGPTIGGISETTFHHLEIDKSDGSARLEQVIGVDHELRMTAANLDLNGYDLTLGSANGQIVDEKETSRLIGPNGGEAVKTVNLNAPNLANPGNIGLEITSTVSLGSTEIRRGHVPQDVVGQEGIERYFTLSPTNNINLDAIVRFQYFNGELNGLTESELEPWRYDGVNWSNYAATDSDPTANWVETTNIDAFSTWTLGQGALKVFPKIFLEGPYAAGLMNDDLRATNLLPISEPYTGLGFVQVGGGGGETVSPGVFAITGNDAIVDWVFLELRDKSDHTFIIKTRSALLQQDGDIVDLNGISPVSWTGLPADEYYLVARHRNHLGIMSSVALPLSINSSNYDFTSDVTATYGSTNGIKDLGDGFFGLFSGDFDLNGQVQNADRAALLPNIGSAGYLSGDLDLNGEVQNSDVQEKLVPNIGNGEQHN